MNLSLDALRVEQGKALLILLTLDADKGEGVAAIKVYALRDINAAPLHQVCGNIERAAARHKNRHA